MLSTEDVAVKDKQNAGGCYCYARYVVLLMTSLGSFNLYATRNSLNVAIVAMVSTNSSQTYSSNNSWSNNSNFNQECAIQNFNESTNTENKIHDSENGKFQWSLAQQGLLLGCYYYGYACTNALGAWLASRFGIRLTLFVSTLSASALTILMPFAANSSFELCVALRIVIGFLQGPTFPIIMTAIGIWAPPLERSRFVAFSFAGTTGGNLIVYSLTGLITSIWYWEAAFYFFGALSCVWAIAWYVLIRDTPASHPRISKEEIAYITNTTEATKLGQNKVRNIPWKNIFLSVPYWATVAAHLTENWYDCFGTPWIPTYMAKILGFDIKAVGFASSLPYIFRSFFLILAAFGTDFVLTKKWARIIVVRKIVSGFGFIVPSISLIILGYVGCNPVAAVALLCIILSFLSVNYSGYRCSVVDIAPSYCGIMYAISNTFCSILGFVAPQVAGSVLDAHEGISGWKLLFWVASATLLVGITIYFVFGTDQVQSWAKECRKEDEIAENGIGNMQHYENL